MSLPPSLTDQARRRRELLRRRFRPNHLRLLFVGESPPASGRFFYQADSGLYRAMRDAFQLIDPTITDTNFLHKFQACGCFLIDLCLDPVDHLPAPLRQAACAAAEPSLARALQRLQPERIATVVRSIEKNFARAATRAHWQGPVLHLPYPGRWSRQRHIFVRSLAPELRPL